MSTVPTHRRAFTLIELLVVISIVAILIALLLPALNKARQRTMQLKCAVQLRTITTGALAYAADNKGWGLPYAYWGDVNVFGGKPPLWVPYYFPATSKESGHVTKPTFICPGADPKGRLSATYQYGRYSSKRFSTSYFFHFCTGTRNWKDRISYYGNVMYHKSTKELPRINAPRLSLLGTTDSAPWIYAGYRPIYIPSPSEQPAVEDAFGINGTWSNAGHRLLNNHYKQGGHNVSYIDGHVKWLNNNSVIERHQDYYNHFYY